MYGNLYNMTSSRPSAASPPMARFPEFAHDTDNLCKPDSAAKEQHKQRGWGPTEGEA